MPLLSTDWLSIPRYCKPIYRIRSWSSHFQQSFSTTLCFATIDLADHIPETGNAGFASNTAYFQYYTRPDHSIIKTNTYFQNHVLKIDKYRLQTCCWPVLCNKRLRHLRSLSHFTWYQSATWHHAFMQEHLICRHFCLAGDLGGVCILRAASESG